MSSSRLLPCHDTVFEACVDGRNLLPGSAASLRLSRSRFSVRSVSRIIRPRSFYLSRSGSRMNGDDRRRSRRWNEVKPFRAAAPAWLPAFQAPANLLQYERTQTDTYADANARAPRWMRERKRRGYKWKWRKREKRKCGRMGFIIHFPSWRDLPLFASSPPLRPRSLRPINDRPNYSQCDQRALAAKRAPVGGLIG